jgi:hypothetical protein
VISPHRVAEIERAWIRDAAHDSTRHGTDGSARAGIAGNGADRGTCTGAKQAATYGSVAGIRSAS